MSIWPELVLAGWRRGREGLTLGMSLQEVELRLERATAEVWESGSGPSRVPLPTRFVVRRLARPRIATVARWPRGRSTGLRRSRPCRDT